MIKSTRSLVKDAKSDKSHKSKLERTAKNLVSHSGLVKEKSEPETSPNPNFYWGTQDFKLENGDSYSGDYCCHKTGIIWREGQGVYSTKDGHIYEGTWENDQLLNSPESKVTFPSGDQYIGPIINSKYSGEGTYIFSNQLELKAHFENNKPVGEVTLIDYEGQLWTGPAEENYALLLSTNHFFHTLPYWRGIGEEVNVEDEKAEESESKIEEPTMDELEKIYFKKSSKTNVSTGDKYDSKITYCQDTNLSKSIKKYITEEMKLAEKSSCVSMSALKMFFSRSWRQKSKPISVITPTCDIDKVEEEYIPEEIAINESEKLISQTHLNQLN